MGYRSPTIEMRDIEREAAQDANIERLERGISRIHEYLVANRIGDAMFDCEALLCGSKHEIRHATDTIKR